MAMRNADLLAHALGVLAHALADVFGALQPGFFEILRNCSSVCFAPARAVK
jgi:hypothetical protein